MAGRAFIRARVQLDGLKELRDRLREIEQKTRKKLVRQAVRAGGQVILQEMKAHVPVSTGTLRKSLGIRIVTSRRTGAMSAIIGPRTKFIVTITSPTGRAIKRWATKYAHLDEFGHGGPHPAPPFPFERPAWEAGVARAEQVMADVIAQGLEAG